MSDCRDNLSHWEGLLAGGEFERVEGIGEGDREDAFYHDLAFGTGGLHSKPGLGPNHMNVYAVSKATQGLVDYLNANFGVSPWSRAATRAMAPRNSSGWNIARKAARAPSSAPLVPGSRPNPTPSHTRRRTPR